MSRFGSDNPRLQISLHDVMPQTLDRIAEQIELLDQHGKAPGSLLVVPGLDWDKAGLAQLRRWQDLGWELIGHGWSHHCAEIRGLHHRLHSLFISRDCAEHLALDAEQIRQLMTRCRQWFDEHDLALPSCYVPPAWALGSVNPKTLAATGFVRVETLSGLWDLESGRHRKMALIGFEADTRLRAVGLRTLNGLNGWIHRAGAGLRIALHPHDHHLHLARSLHRWLDFKIR